MAVDLDRNKVVFERLDNFEKRITDAETQINNIFNGYNIPADATDYNEKYSYVLSSIGDDQNKRKVFKVKFNEAEKSFREKTASLKEDFIFLYKQGNKNLEKLAAEIEAEEEILKKDEAEKSDNEERVKSLITEIEELNIEKEKIGGTDKKGGQIGAEIAECRRLDKENDNFKKEIAAIEAKIADIQKEIADKNEKMKNAKTKDEINQYFADISSLEGNIDKLNLDKGDLTTTLQNNYADKVNHENYIRDLERDYDGIVSQIGIRTSEKNGIDSQLRILSSRRPELDNMKKNLAGQVEKFDNTIEKLTKILSDKGIDVDLEEINKEDSKGKEDKGEKEDKKEKAQSNSGNGGGYGGGYNTVTPKSDVPAVKPEDIKKKNYDYIIGYTDKGAGLTSEDRLKRIQSELGGRDYEAMIKAFTELKNSPIKLTRAEKIKLKETMLQDKKNLSENIKEINTDKIDELSRTVGIPMTKSELKGLYYYSYDDKANNGILGGFDHMPKESKTKWEQVVQAYGKKKDGMSSKDIANFEKYVMTPLKFGTLHQQAKELYRNPISKTLSNIVVQFQGGNKLVEDIRSAIAEAEVPEGQSLKSKSDAMKFSDELKGLTEEKVKGSEEKSERKEKNPPESEERA
jgi:hypothetical protein